MLLLLHFAIDITPNARRGVGKSRFSGAGGGAGGGAGSSVGGGNIIYR